MKNSIRSYFKILPKSSSLKSFNKTARSGSSTMSKSTNYTIKHSYGDLLEKNKTHKYNIPIIKQSNKPRELNIGQFFFVFGEDSSGDIKNSNDIMKKLTAWDIEHLDDQDESKQKYLKSLKETTRNILLTPRPIESVGISLLLKTSQEMKAKEKEKERKERMAAKAHHLFNLNTNLKIIFFFNYDVFLGYANKIEEKNESIIKSEQKLEIAVKNDLNQPNYFRRLLRDQIKIENDQREELRSLYQTLLILKLKKNKYKRIIDDAYILLDEARLETALTLDLLNDRRSAVNKRYQAFIHQPINPIKELDEEQKRREYEEALAEKMKSNRYRQRKMNKLVFNNDNGSQSTIARRVSGKSRQSNHLDEYQIFKKKKKTLLEIYDEKMKIHQQYNDIIQELNSQTLKHTDQFASIKKELTEIVNKNKEEVESLAKEHFNNTLLFQTKIKDQQKYYLQILKQGLDTRNEGLSWVIKRLFELNMTLENRHFPNFLDSEQIDYLLNISRLGFESYQLKLILKTLKNRQRKIFEKQTINRVNKINSYANKVEQEKNKIIGKVEKKEPYIEKYHQKIIFICSRNKDIFKNQLESKIEEKHITSIVRGIKESLLEYAVNGKNFVNEKEESVVKFMIENEKQKEFFDDIIALRRIIKEIDFFYKAMFKEQSQAFKQKFYFIRQKQSDKAAVYYDNIYNALFGTNLIEINEQDFL